MACYRVTFTFYCITYINLLITCINIGTVFCTSKDEICSSSDQLFSLYVYSGGCPTETNCMEQIPLWETVAQLVHFIAFCGAQRFITTFTRAAYKSMPWGFQEVEAPRFHDSQHMRVVRLSGICTSCLYTQEIFLVPISVRGWVNPRAIVWPEGLCRRKIPMTPSGIKSVTLQLVAECVNQLRHRVPQEQLITVLLWQVDLVHTLTYYFCVRFILILPSHVCWGFPSDRFPPGSLTKLVLHFSCACYMAKHLALLVVISGEMAFLTLNRHHAKLHHETSSKIFYIYCNCD